MVSIESDGAMGLVVFLGEIERQQSAAGHAALVEDESGVGFYDIAFGSNGVVIAIEFFKLVLMWDNTIFGPPTSRAIAAVR